MAIQTGCVAGCAVVAENRLPMQLTSLEATPFSLVHDCFIQSFGDYAVDMSSVTEAVLRRRAFKNDWVPALSSGALDGNALVAITLVGMDEVAGERIAYDICTGVTPGHRGQALAGKMLDDIMRRLKDSKITAMQLEVLANNTPAIRAYERAGFYELRELLSYTGLTDANINPDSTFTIEDIDVDQLTGLNGDLDYQPSFEQRDRAIRNLADELIMLGAFSDDRLIAAIAHDPVTDWLMRLVTRRSHRRQGAATILIRHLADRLGAGQPVKAINLDSRDHSSHAFFNSVGLERSLVQKEMRLNLD